MFRRTEEKVDTMSEIISEIVHSPINLALIAVIAFLVYKIWKSHMNDNKASTFVPEPELPKLRRDFTLKELKPYDGTGPDGRVLVAVNGSVYDVTKGKRFYGPGTSHLTSMTMQIMYWAADLES